MKKNVELRNCRGKGDGVYALKSFRAGDTVIVGVIEVFVSENNARAIQIGENQFVVQAGLSMMVNHSCEPNCGIRVNESGGHDYVARKAISVNDEITFDYAMQNYTIDYFPAQCMCGSRNCRGLITGWKDLPEQKKAEYAGFVAPYLFELDSRVARSSHSLPSSLHGSK